jgi:uncharacterized membrane protein
MAPQTEEGGMARAVHWTLLSGLTLSVLLLLSGGVMLVLRPQVAQQSDPVAVQFPIRAVHGDGAALLELGLVILMLTPVARVLVLAIGWLVHRDWTFGLIACCVLALLATSLLLGTN